MSAGTRSVRLSRYLTDVWELRYFWISLVRLDLRNRYKRSILGVGWSLLNPIAMTAILCVVFAGVWNQDIREYAPFVLCGIALWNFVTAIVTEGCHTFYAAEGYIRSERTPLAIFPLRTLLASMFHFLVILAVTLVVTSLARGFPNVMPLLTLLATLAVLCLFGWAVATLMGVAAAYFPDVQHLSTIGLQMLFYLTPILYPAGMLEGKKIGLILKLNPLGAFVDLLRTPILDGRVPALASFYFALGFSLLLVAAAITLLARCEKRLIFAL
jgi:ABC-type polysaccharide/polyol phosphate export permease